MSQNYTPIDDLIKKLSVAPTYPITQPAEAEPIIKKSESVRHTAEQKDIHEVVERETHPEVKKHIEVRPETVNVDPDLQKIGVRATQHRQHFPDYKRVVLPISDAAVLKGLHAPLLSSFRWLAEFCVLMLKRAHLHLQIVHGKVRRVLDRRS